MTFWYILELSWWFSAGRNSGWFAIYVDIPQFSELLRIVSCCFCPCFHVFFCTPRGPTTRKREGLGVLPIGNLPAIFPGHQPVGKGHPKMVGGNWAPENPPWKRLIIFSIQLYIYIYIYYVYIYIFMYIYIYVIHMYISLLRWRVVNSTISLLPFPLFLTSWKHRMTWVLRIWPDRGNVPRMKQGDGVTIINSWDKTWLLLGKSIQIMDDLIKTKHDTSRILEPWSTHTFTPLHLWLSKQMEFGYDYKTTSNSHFFWKGHSSERVFEFVWK